MQAPNARHKHARQHWHSASWRCRPTAARPRRRAILQGKRRSTFLVGERTRRRQRPDRPADLPASDQAHSGQSQHRRAEPAVVPGLALINRVYNTPEKDGLLIGIVERGAPRSPSWRPQRALRPAQDHLARQRVLLRPRCLHALGQCELLREDGGRPAQDRTPLREDRLDRRGRHQRHLHQHRQRTCSS